MKKSFGIKLTALLAAIITAIGASYACNISSSIKLPSTCSGSSVTSTAAPTDEGGNGATAITGREQSRGKYTVIVPDGMQISDLEDDPSILFIENRENKMQYLSFGLEIEENAVANIKKTTELYNGSEAFTEAGGVTWKGVSYRMDTTPCFEMYGMVGGRAVVVKSVGYDYMSAEVNTILGSISVAD